jgi:hypothetical protein
MGLHTGEADERRGNYFGSAVNRAARVMALAYGGQVVASGATADMVADTLPAGVKLVDPGGPVMDRFDAVCRHVEALVQAAGKDDIDDVACASLEAVDAGYGRDVIEHLALLVDCVMCHAAGLRGVSRNQVAAEAFRPLLEQVERLHGEVAEFLSS